MQSIDKGSYFNYKNNANTIFAVERLTYIPINLTLLLGVSTNGTSYNREDLLALKGLAPNYNKDLSFSKKYGTVVTPHIALQKLWKNQIFNLSYSEGYNAPTAAISLGNATSTNAVNDALAPERARMWDFSMHGLLDKTRLDYQLSVFNIDIRDKLTSVRTPSWSYWANTGQQQNRGFEGSIGYIYHPTGWLTAVKPFINYSYYDFKYNTLTINGADYSNKRVVGVPRNKYAIGLDFDTSVGLYLINTFNYLGSVYSDFGNTNLVKAFGLLNAKVGYRQTFGKWNVDAFIAGNNLTNQINYTFLFLGNNINDSDVNSNYPGVKTDLNPGPKKAYYFYGLNLKYHF